MKEEQSCWDSHDVAVAEIQDQKKEIKNKKEKKEIKEEIKEEKEIKKKETFDQRRQRCDHGSSHWSDEEAQALHEPCRAQREHPDPSLRGFPC